MKKIMISGTHSGVGKTTITLGIMSALKKKGYEAQPYKVGPDYIDPSYHNYVTGRNSRNLDSYMLDEEQMKFVMKKASKDCDISVVEGVMGLYDGLGTDIDNSTSSYVSKVLKLPVILVIDAKAQIASAAAMVKGFVELDKDVMIVGVIANNIKSQNHYELVKESIERYCGVEVLGYLPPVDAFSVKSRHLGLIPVYENEIFREGLDELTDKVIETIDVDRIVELSESEALESAFELSMFTEDFEIRSLAKGKKVGIAFDKAFNFYYQENLELLKSIGLELVFFSPLEDEKLPDVDLLYIGGGFPEVFAKELFENKSMRESIKEACEKGLVVYAECGGIMYLGKKITDLDGNEFEMVGFYEGKSIMTEKLKRFGYCMATAKEDTLIALKGEQIRGHEFHYSFFETEMKPDFDIIKIRDDKVVKSWEGGYSKKNTLATYIHTHFFNNLNMLVNILRRFEEV